MDFMGFRGLNKFLSTINFIQSTKSLKFFSVSRMH